MTTLTIGQIPSAPTLFERSLLDLSSRLAELALQHAQHRASARRRHALWQAEAATERRRDATALAHAGILPR